MYSFGGLDPDGVFDEYTTIPTLKSDKEGNGIVILDRITDISFSPCT
jgi:hypothetical protein